MGADLFESYVGALVSAITLGLVATNIGSASHFMAALFPLVIAGVGIVASVIATFFVREEKTVLIHRKHLMQVNIQQQH